MCMVEEFIKVFFLITDYIEENMRHLTFFFNEACRQLQCKNILVRLKAQITRRSHLQPPLFREI